MDHSMLGRALNQETSGDRSPLDIKNHSPFLESLHECWRGPPTASWVGGIHVCITLLLVELKTWEHLVVMECCSALHLCQLCGALRSEQPPLMWT